jgi:hypothetical protein
MVPHSGSVPMRSPERQRAVFVSGSTAIKLSDVFQYYLTPCQRFVTDFLVLCVRVGVLAEEPTQRQGVF